MTEFKGRHFGFLALLCGTWAAARVATSFMSVGAPLAVPKAVAGVAVAAGEAPSFAGQAPVRGTRIAACCNLRLAATRTGGHWHHAVIPTFHPPMLYPPGEPALPASRSANLIWRPPTTEASPGHKLKANVYAYSFWRFQAPGHGLAAGGQYGGSQSGLIATIGFAPGAPALLLRTAVAHNNLRDREFAIGARWQPKTEWPVSVTAERRFRNIGADSFALYVAGGRGDIRLPAGFRLETYAQAGVVSGNGGSYFFDAQARADRQVLPQTPVPLHVGGGVWTGGQRGTMRLDIGPSLRTEVPIGDIRIRVTADWRFRVAGNAAPGNGPALTVSTGF